MDALRGYGSSDENNSEDESIEVKPTVPEIKNETDVSKTEELSTESPSQPIKFSSSLALKICAAPEVVGTVSFDFEEFYNFNSSSMLLTFKLCQPVIIVMYVHQNNYHRAQNYVCNTLTLPRKSWPSTPNSTSCLPLKLVLKIHSRQNNKKLQKIHSPATWKKHI